MNYFQFLFSGFLLISLFSCSNAERDANNLYVQADNLIKNNEYGKATELLTQAVKIKPDFAGGLYVLGDLYYRRSSLDTAIDLFSKSLALQPDNFDCANKLANALGKRTV
ncbi:MAG: tetratricopeptide repeat protein [Ignavibacteria bacterium]|nr:tetratricopeptide repeat protein [Ignavibacteria bacterium]